MLIDAYGRKIDYIRLSLTDKCNFCCRYCREESGVDNIPHQNILSLEKMYQIVKEFVRLGITKVRLTGGEPLVKKNFMWLVQKIGKLDGVKDLCLTTNGSLFAQYARELKLAGLNRVNFSLDTLDPEKFHYITRRGDLATVLAGIKAAQDEGFSPIKINTVLIKGFNDSAADREAMQQFCQEQNIIGRTIKEMNLENGSFEALITDEPDTTAGVCHKCNKLRITCDGKILPCLFSDRAVDIKAENSIEASIHKAIQIKPKSGLSNTQYKINQIGG